MTMLAVLLNVAVSAGLLAMASRYVRAVPPLDYHAAIVADEIGRAHV